MHPHAASILVAALLALPGGAAASEGERRAGDVLSYALPAATLGVEWWRGDRTGAIQFSESFVATLAVTEVLKRSTGVERPDGSNDQSFPSGHAARAFAAATYVHRRHGFQTAWPLYAIATYVGYTRVQAKRHRWADVVGAAALSGAMSWWLVSADDRPRASVALRHRSVCVHWSMPLH